MRVYLVTLGCPKNEVISDNMAQLLMEAGHIIVAEPRSADALLVNTCGFIKSARLESSQTVLELAERKKDAQKLVVIGCWPQLVGPQILTDFPTVDGLLGVRRWMEIDRLLTFLDAGVEQKIIWLNDLPDSSLAFRAGRPLRSRPGASAYVSIADGCSAGCAFCSIPNIKGKLRSRLAADILDEVRYLVDGGARELILVAQDTTAYGLDRGEKDGLPHLLRQIVKNAPELVWLRLMYAYPQHVTPQLIATMAEEPKLCHYLDLPLQHAHPQTLQRMRRPHNVKEIRRTLNALRTAMPDIALRTSFIVGYPGETEEEFRALLDFVEEVAFDKVGVFMYSREAGTPAYDLPDQIPQPMKEERYHRLMQVQQAISLARNRAQIGCELDVLVEGQGDGISVGRSYRDAPEVDGLVIFKGRAPVGEFVRVRVVGADTYDLTGSWLRRRRTADSYSDRRPPVKP